MRVRSIWVHGIALALAIPAAYLTWTRDPDAVAKIGATLMWNGDRDDVLSVALHNRALDVAIAPQTDGGSYLWGTRITHLRSAADSTAYPMLVGLPDSVGFLVDETSGRDVMSLAAAPAAIRDLGPVVDSLVPSYGFDKDTSLVRVVFRDRTEDMLVGGAVYGSEDRYVLRLSDRRVYVLPGAPIGLLRGADVTLTDRRYHTFQRDSIATLRIVTDAGTKTWSAVSLLGSTVQYAPPDDPEKVDVGLSNLIGQLDDAGIIGYRPELDPAALKRVMRAEYLKADSSALGFLELYERPGADGKAEHFVRTEHTRVVAQTYDELAQMIRSSLERLF